MAKLKFPELFEIEIDGWRHGIEENAKNLTPKLLHSVIKEMSESFLIAIEKNYVFDILKIAENISKASNNIANPKEITFYILATFPHPEKFNDEQKQTLAKLIDQVEKKYGGAKDRLMKKWGKEKLG